MCELSEATEDIIFLFFFWKSEIQMIDFSNYGLICSALLHFATSELNFKANSSIVSRQVFIETCLALRCIHLKSWQSDARQFNRVIVIHDGLELLLVFSRAGVTWWSETTLVFVATQWRSWSSAIRRGASIALPSNRSPSTSSDDMLHRC